jgi:hypothetical protein
MIPDNVLSPYALMDGIATIILFNVFMKQKLEYIDKGWNKLERIIEVKNKITEMFNRIGKFN